MRGRMAICLQSHTSEFIVAAGTVVMYFWWRGLVLRGTFCPLQRCAVTGALAAILLYHFCLVLRAAWFLDFPCFFHLPFLLAVSRVLQTSEHYLPSSQCDSCCLVHLEKYINGVQRTWQHPISTAYTHQPTFQHWMIIAQPAGMLTSRDVLDSSRKRNTMICETRSVTSARTDRPARLLFSCQKLMSDLKARNSKSRCSEDASIVTASR